MTVANKKRKKFVMKMVLGRKNFQTFGTFGLVKAWDLIHYHQRKCFRNFYDGTF